MDLISRQAAIEALKAHEDYKGYLHGDFEEILEEMPSAQPEIRYYGQFEIKDPILISEWHWIPCSERLPEEGRCVLVTVHPDYIAPGILAVEKLNYYNGEWVSYDGERLEKFPDPIIAWMPLPEPYKGESDG